MERVLLVEDAKFFGSMIEKRLRNSMGLDVVWCETLKETRAALETSSDFTLALLDLTLPTHRTQTLLSSYAATTSPAWCSPQPTNARYATR